MANVWNEAMNKAQAFHVVNLVGQLLARLNTRVLAYMVGLDSVTPLNMWHSGISVPNAEQLQKMRDVYCITELLLNNLMSREAMESWLVGMNPDLDDEAPSEVYRESPQRVIDVVQHHVMTS